MFVPETGNGWDVLASLSIMLIVLFQLADVLSTRWGIWNNKFAESNRIKLIQWLTAPDVNPQTTPWYKSAAFRGFIDFGGRLFLICAYARALYDFGALDNAHIYLPLSAAAASAYGPVKNAILLLKKK